MIAKLPTADPCSPYMVWSAYNRAMVRGGLAPLPDSRFRPLRQHFQALGEFCRSNGISPERWISAKHEAVGWRFRLRIQHLPKASERFMHNFKGWGDAMQAESQSQERIATLATANLADSAGLTPLGERAKGAFAAEPGLCRISTDMTGGWNPASRWCSTCSLASQCQGGADVGR